MKLTKQDFLWLFSIGIAPFHSGISALILFFLVGYVVFSYFLTKNKEPVKAARFVSVVFLTYYLYFFVNSWFHSSSLIEAWGSMEGNIPILLIGIYGFFMQKSTHDFSSVSLGKWSTNAVLMTVIFAVVLFYWRFYMTDDFPNFLSDTWQINRLEMFSRNPLMFASLLLALSSLCVLGCYQKKNYVNAISFTALFLGWAVVFFMAQSRGALITSIPLVVLIITYTKVKVSTALYVVAGLTVLVCLAYFNINWVSELIDDFYERISRLINAIAGKSNESSTNSRLMMYENAISAITEKPWFGYGYNHRFDPILQFLDYKYNGFMHSHIHNSFLNHMIAGGFFGLLVFCLFLSLPLALLLKFKQASKDEKYLAWVILITMNGIGMTTAILGHYVHSTFYSVLIMTLAILISKEPLSNSSK